MSRPLQHPKKVKIIATIGPSSESSEKIIELANAGVDIFRINLSYAVREEILDRIQKIRQAEKITGWPLAVMGDLVGPKIRIGTAGPGVNLETGKKFKIYFRQTYGSAEGISINFPSILKNLEKSHEIYLGDGEIKLEVVSQSSDSVITRVVGGGELRDRMGFSSHGISMRFPLTEKDEYDIKLMCDLGADALAVSFVQSAKDIEEVKKLLPSRKPPILIAKIETLAAVGKAEEILEVSNGMMIARSDLGFSVPLPELPHIQKNLINLALKKSKPVITATPMLESMINSRFPTRTEVTDVANAILDGTDAVMLSDETAIGKFPIETVKMMARIIREAEIRVEKRDFSDTDIVADTTSVSTVNIAERTNSRLIVVFTQTGHTAHLVTRHKPSQLILALSPDPETIRNLNFSWGVYSQLIKPTENLADLLTVAKRIVKTNDFFRLKKGENFVICAGAPFGKSGTTNLIWVNKS